MKTIYKYPLEVTDRQRIALPAGQLLSLKVQNGQPVMWLLQESGAPKSAREVIFVGTGHEVPQDAGEYIGTAMLQGGHLVLHAFFAKQPAEKGWAN